MESRRKHIVIVDDNPVNLDLAEAVLKETYKITKLVSGIQLLKFLLRIRPDMIMLDIKMPEMDGYETLAEIKKMEEWRDIPVIFLTGQKDSASEQEGFRLGAQDFIGKPFHSEVMLSRVNAQMELYGYRNNLEGIIREKTKKIEDLQHIITVSWAEMVEARDGTTGSHVRNTARYYRKLLGFLQNHSRYRSEFPQELLEDYVSASYLHDIGKIEIKDEILKKPAALTKEEYEFMQTHTVIGSEIIHKMIETSHTNGFLVYAERMALEHHERWDGSGYPNGKAGEEIPVYIRALSIADVYDALTSVRPYKKAFSHEEAINLMLEDCGKFFCPSVFQIFLENQDVIRTEMENKTE